MKKSEFDRKLGERAAWRTDNRHAGEWTMVDRSDLHALLEEAGTPWDPEEPELPERVGVAETGRIKGLVLFPEDSSGEHESSLKAIALEAAARYNAVGALLRRLRDPDDMGTMDCSDLESQLETERERLQ